MGGCLRWVVALRPEAQAVIERYRMKPAKTGGTLFPVYVSPDKSMQLVISGPGYLNSAAATGFLAGTRSGDSGVAAWLNFGIAGCGSFDRGRVFLGSKIEAESSSEVWYPTAVWPKKADLERRVIRTVDVPTTSYPGDGVLVEMEASGFYPVAVRDASLELCQVMKVVSDDPDHSMTDLSKRTVTTLCHEALNQADSWLGAFRSLIAEEDLQQSDPSGFEELTGKLRFTVTEQHQLRRLLQQWRALESDPPKACPDSAMEAEDAKACLQQIRERVHDLRHDLGASVRD